MFKKMKEKKAYAEYIAALSDIERNIKETIRTEGVWMKVSMYDELFWIMLNDVEFDTEADDTYQFVANGETRLGIRLKVKGTVDNELIDVDELKYGDELELDNTWSVHGGINGDIYSGSQMQAMAERHGISHGDMGGFIGCPYLRRLDNEPLLKRAGPYVRGTE